MNPEINAIISPLYEEAKSDAAGELPDGPFRGVPFVFKDLGAGLAGQPFHMGNRLLKEIDFRVPFDTHLGSRFRDAGLVTIGRSSTPEFGILPTTEPVAYGQTKNPWDPTRTTGGSSGGSAAAVAAGIVPMAHASDGGGSIRIPASANGLFGLKASRGRISQAPLNGDTMSGLTTELVVSKSVRDTAAMLDWVHGPVAGDPYGCPVPAHPYVEDLEISPGNLRIALLTEPMTGGVLDSEIVEAARAAGRKLEALGHQVTEPELPPAGDGDVLFETFITRWAAGMSQTVSVIGAIVGRDLTADDVEPLTWALAQRGRNESGATYLEAIQQHQVMARMIASLYGSDLNPDGFDLIMTPTLATVPPKLGFFDDSGPDPMEAMSRARDFANFTGAFNASGQPAISLPMETSAEGMPLGMQLIAPLWREDLLIQIAAQVEAAQPLGGSPRAAFC
ncbi:MAG: amidase [Solirubrobacterales bacterium]|nr:amidase [Solirubrobacterales bacterium]